MPTIQLKLTDEEYQDLLQFTGLSTGIKAAMHCINQYQDLVSDLHDAKRCHYEAEAELCAFKETYHNYLDSKKHLDKLMEGFEPA